MKRLLVAVVLLAGCDPIPALDLERMRDQSNVRPYQATAYFENGRALQPPVVGTVARETPDQSPFTTGLDGAGDPLTRLPLPLDRRLLERGRDRFSVYCATCHGVRGDGRS